MKKDNVIFQDSNRRNISNAKTSHLGIEFAFNYALTNNLTLSSNISYSRHQYDKDITLRGSSGDIRGNDIDTAPRRMGSSRLNWKIRPSNHIELEWVYLGPYYTDPDNFHNYKGHNLLPVSYTHLTLPTNREV